MLNNKFIKLTVAGLSMFAATLMIGQAQAAKGSGGGGGVSTTPKGVISGGVGGREFVVLPGKCTSANTVGSGALTSIDNNWQFGLTVVGPRAGGNWVIDSYKNGVFHATSNSFFPSGWTAFEIGTSRLLDKGTVVLTIIATNKDNGEICDATVSVKV